MYRIETYGAHDPSSLGPSIQLEDARHARAFADGLRAEGLEVQLLHRESVDAPWRTVAVESLTPPQVNETPQPGRLLDEYVVIARCLAGARESDYELATPTIFLTRSLAQDYATAIDPARVPLVVRGRFSALAF